MHLLSRKFSIQTTGYKILIKKQISPVSLSLSFKLILKQKADERKLKDIDQDDIVPHDLFERERLDGEEMEVICSNCKQLFFTYRLSTVSRFSW